MSMAIDTHNRPKDTPHLQQEKTKTRLMGRASDLGQSVLAFVQALWTADMRSTALHASRLIRLASAYGPARLEAACRRALFYRSGDYATVKRILENHLETLPLNPHADIYGQLALFPVDSLEECGVQIYP